ncbi:hypothetical protein ACGVWS_12610 [Enterobacteriaceae bacterium LUAb1]
MKEIIREEPLKGNFTAKDIDWLDGAILRGGNKPAEYHAVIKALRSMLLGPYFYTFV